MDEGGDVTFTPTLSGGAPDSYKWTVTNGTIKGSDTLPTVVVTAGTAGECSVNLTVTNKIGSGKGTGKVTVQTVPLNIVSHPENQTITVGEDLNLKASVDDDEGISWKWIKDGSDIAGATGSGATATYNKSPSEASDAGDYTVTFTRAKDGSEVTSNVATVTVNAPAKKPQLKWTQDLDNTPLNLNSGEDVTLEVTAEVVEPAKKRTRTRKA